MQLNLFEWDLIAVGSGYSSLVELDFDTARNRFAYVLKSLPDHPGAETGMRDLRHWEGVFADAAGMEADTALCFLWDAINDFRLVPLGITGSCG